MFIFIYINIKLRFQFSRRLIFDGKDDTSHEPIAQSSFSYSFSNDDCHKVSRSLKKKYNRK